MSIIRLNPMFNLLDEFEDFGGMSKISNLMKNFVPALDVYDDGKNVVVVTPLAGIRPEDVNVSVEKGVLTLTGENKKEHEVDDKNYYRKEIRSGSFFRQVALPTAVNETQVKAEFEDGVLKITCPKIESAKVKKIDIKVIKKNKK